MGDPANSNRDVDEEPFSALCGPGKITTSGFGLGGDGFFRGVEVGWVVVEFVCVGSGRKGLGCLTTFSGLVAFFRPEDEEVRVRFGV